MDIQTNGAIPPVATSLPQTNTSIEARRELLNTVTQTKDNQRSDLDDKQAKTPASLQDIEKATDQVKKFVSPVNNDIQFSIDDETGITVVKVVDKSTNEIIRQIPGDEILQIAKALDRLQGLLVKQQA
ncbi:MAG: flagellar protein [Proteobacteria bacterium]|nr:flagellar protein [Pseudomonadota bacterium]